MKRNKWMLIAFLFLAIACKKGEEDVTPPQIAILSPESNSEWLRGDSLMINVLIEDEDLHEYYISISNIENISYEFKTHTHEQKINYKRAWVLDFKGDYILRIKASDHNGNSAQDSVLFKVR